MENKPQIVLVMVLSSVLSLLVLMSTANPSFAQQQNQTNTTTAMNQTGGAAMTTNQTQNETGGEGAQQQQQSNQTESGTASGIENLTGGSSGNTGLLQKDTDIGGQNTSITGGMEQEQEATEITNATSMQQEGNQTGGEGPQQQNQTQQESNQTQGGPLEQLGETLGGIFGGQ